MNDIEIIGQGDIGDKARQLVNKTPKLKEIGFYVPKRTVLAEDYFDGFFQRNSLGKNLRNVEIVGDLEARILRGSLTAEEFQVLQKISFSHGSNPLIVRSSAEGDSRGTGTYSSKFTENQISPLRKSMQAVLASYFSEDAIAFRRDAETGEGFGMIIEPIIGQNFDRCFAPILSGFGYTSTSRGEGYITVVPGLGGGVDSQNGEKITESAIKGFNGHLGRYLLTELGAMYSILGGKTKRKSALLGTDNEWYSRDSLNGSAYFFKNKWAKAHVSNASLDLKKIIYEINLDSFFEMMRKMEDSFGKPQYLEWAMTLENNEPRYWITQVADINKKLDVIDFGDLGNVIFMGHTVTGTGSIECHKIANCWNAENIQPLYEFNKQNKDYMLLFSSRLTTAIADRRLRYKDFNNASAFLEIQDARHVGDPVAHLGGQLDMAGKLFGVLDYDSEIPPNWDKFDSDKRDEGGIKIYQGKVKVLASERQNRMVVSALD